MRAFVALEVQLSVLDSLAGFQQELSATGADMKLVDRGNLHFTVKFLGEISETQAAEAKDRLGGLSLTGADVEVKGAGAFPSPSRPRVLWAGVAGDHSAILADIANAVIASLRGLGEADVRPFQPHITLARVRSTRNLSQLANLVRENSKRSFGLTKLTELKLKSSLLTQSGPVYSDVGVYPLR